MSKIEIIKDIFKSVDAPKENIFVFDLDGTLVDINHRMHLYEKGDWEAFNKLCVNDTPIEPTVNMARLLARNFAVEIWTARNEIARVETEEQLKGLNIDYKRLVMRPFNNDQPDPDLKRSWFESRKSANPNFDIITVYEDRQSVVNMWRSLGVTCYQVAEGNF